MSSLESFLEEKILSPDSLSGRLEKERSQGKTLATINGSFDLLHAGHLYILFEASKQADILLVAVNSDASVQAYKDPRRPIIPLQSRMEMLAALDFVDFVTWFDETDPRVLLAKVAPDIHVNGKEYGEECIEAKTVLENGGRLHLVNRIPGLATSEIIEKIVSLETTCV